MRGAAHRIAGGIALGLVATALGTAQAAEIGREVAIPRHLENGEEFRTPTRALLEHGRALFAAPWTVQEGAGRPLTKGTGAPLSDPFSPLLFPRNFNRVSAPDANSCAGCHNAPFGIAGGGGDIVANVFVLGQRFDFVTLDPDDTTPTRGSTNEAHELDTLQTLANSRNTLGMFGSGYIEMLARQMTRDLQAIRDGIAPGGTGLLRSKGVDFGVLRRGGDGSWDTSGVEGLATPSLASSGPANPPSLIIRPFHQAGMVISLREFTNNAMNHHHGIQSQERFGVGTDPDGDGFRDELTRADVTAASVFQAALPVPGRVIPRDLEVEAAVRRGEQLFAQIGCTDCHRPQLPLDDGGWVFSEPNPYNPPGNLRPGDVPRAYALDLNDRRLPGPRLAARRGVVMVPAFTDLKLHDITEGEDDPNREPLDQSKPAGSSAFFQGNGRFLTRKLWGTANEAPYFHHGQYTTLRDAVLAHHGEAADTRSAFVGMSDADRDSVIEFLKTLQVLPPGSRHLVVDEHGRARSWPEFPAD